MIPVRGIVVGTKSELLGADTFPVGGGGGGGGGAFPAGGGGGVDLGAVDTNPFVPIPVMYS